MIKVAVIGAGFMGKTHLDRYENNPSCQVRYVFDAEISRATATNTLDTSEATDSFSKILSSDVDVVDICLPTFLHREFCLKAAAAGKHILCEKPMALNEAQCDEIIAACRENGVELMIAHVVRFWAEYAYLQETAKDGRFGRLLYLRSGRRQALPAWTFRNWMTDPKLSLGGVVDAQIHDLDLAIGLMGMPLRVKAVGTKSAAGGWEQATTLLEHSGGAVSCTEACNLMPEGYPFTAQFCAVFEKASLDFDSTAQKTLTVREAGKEAYYPTFEGADPYQREIDYFISCLKEGKRITTGCGTDGKNALKLGLAAKESLDTGKEVLLPTI